MKMLSQAVSDRPAARSRGDHDPAARPGRRYRVRHGASRRRAVAGAVGPLLLGLGSGLSLSAGFGPIGYAVLLDGLHAAFGLPSWFAQLEITLACYLIAWLWGRVSPDAGTLPTLLLIGPVTVIGATLTPSEIPFVGDLLAFVAATLLCALGISLAAAAARGPDGITALSLAAEERHGWQVSWTTLLWSALAIAAGATLGGLVGTGTLIGLFGVPALIHLALPRLRATIHRPRERAALHRPAPRPRDEREGRSSRVVRKLVSAASGHLDDAPAPEEPPGRREATARRVRSGLGRHGMPESDPPCRHPVRAAPIHDRRSGRVESVRDDDPSLAPSANPGGDRVEKDARHDAALARPGVSDDPAVDLGRAATDASEPAARAGPRRPIAVRQSGEEDELTVGTAVSLDDLELAVALAEAARVHAEHADALGQEAPGG